MGEVTIVKAYVDTERGAMGEDDEREQPDLALAFTDRGLAHVWKNRLVDHGLSWSMETYEVDSKQRHANALHYLEHEFPGPDVTVVQQPEVSLEMRDGPYRYGKIASISRERIRLVAGRRDADKTWSEAFLMDDVVAIRPRPDDDR